MPWPLPKSEAPAGKRTFAERHNKSLKGPAAAKAQSIANAVLKDSGDEGKAARIASWRTKDMIRRGRISNAAHDKVMKRHQRTAGLDNDRDVDAATR
jgi:uncharacterized protein YdaT